MNVSCEITNTHNFFVNTTEAICGNITLTSMEPIFLQNITTIGWIAIIIYLVIGWITARNHTPLCENFIFIFPIIMILWPIYIPIYVIALIELIKGKKKWILQYVNIVMEMVVIYVHLNIR